MRTTQNETTVSQNRFVIFKRKEPLNGELLDCRHVYGSNLEEIKSRLFPGSNNLVEWIVDATTWSLDEVRKFMAEAGKEVVHA